MTHSMKKYAGVALYFSILILSLIGYTSVFGEIVNPFTTTCPTQDLQGAQELNPAGALWPREIIRQPVTPPGFTMAVGWINAATVKPCMPRGAVATIEIRSMRLIAKDPVTGVERVVQELSFSPLSNDSLEGALFPRLPKWFGETKGVQTLRIDKKRDAAWSINLARASRRIYHAWMAPRMPLEAGAWYTLEVSAKITGEARMQLGMDYWRGDADYNGYSEDCRESNNCEIWVSQWYGETGNRFATLRAPAAFDSR